MYYEPDRSRHNYPGPMTRFVLTLQRSALINPRQNGPVPLYFLSGRRDNQPNHPRILV